MLKTKVQQRIATATFTNLFLVTVVAVSMSSIVISLSAGIIISRRRDINEQVTQRLQDIKDLPTTGKVSGWIFDSPGVSQLEDLTTVPRVLRPFRSAEVRYASDLKNDQTICALTSNNPITPGSFPPCGSGWYTHTLTGPVINVVSLSDDPTIQAKLTELAEQYNLVPHGRVDYIEKALPDEIMELLQDNVRKLQETGYNLAQYEWNKPLGSMEFSAANVFYHINFMKDYLNTVWDEIGRLKNAPPYRNATQSLAVVTSSNITRLLCGIGGYACVFPVQQNGGYYLILYPRTVGLFREITYHEFGHDQHLPIFRIYSEREIDSRFIYYTAYIEGVAEYLAADISNDPENSDPGCWGGLELCFNLENGSLVLEDEVKEAIEKGEYPESHRIGLILGNALWELRQDPLIGKKIVDTLFLESWTQLDYGWTARGTRFSPDATYLDYLNIRNSIIGADRTLYPDPENPEIGQHEERIREAFAHHGVSESSQFIYAIEPEKRDNQLVVRLYSNAVNNCLFSMADRETGITGIADQYCREKILIFYTLPDQGERYVDIAYNDDERNIHLNGECHFVWDDPSQKNSGECRWFE